MKETVEREIKLSAPLGFRLPNLPGERLQPRLLTSTYYDTADYRLASVGVTLRRRVEGGGGVWQLKLPRKEGRLEIEVDGHHGGPPDELRDLLIAFTRGQNLVPVATLRTRRVGIRVVDRGDPVADIVVDSVGLIKGGRVARRLRQIEVELVHGDEGALRRIEKVLRQAGARPTDQRPKLFQLVGLEPILPPHAISRDAPAVDQLRGMLQIQLFAILVHDPGTRLGTDPEELHQMRVATRRLRAFLRSALPMLAREWVESLRAELAWLGDVLGSVRDLDVLLQHLRLEAASLDLCEREAFQPFLEMIEAERARLRAALLEALRSERYLAFLERMGDAVRDLQVIHPNVSLRTVAAREFRKLKRAVQALGDEPSEEALHGTRIRVKRARYAAELAEASVGKPASRFIRKAKLLQDTLGEHQDAVVAEAWIRQLTERIEGPRAALAAGRIIERERHRRQAARAAFPARWAKLERKGEKAWG